MNLKDTPRTNAAECRLDDVPAPCYQESSSINEEYCSAVNEILTVSRILELENTELRQSVSNLTEQLRRFTNV